MRQRAGRMWRSPPVLWAAVAVMAIVAVCGAIVALPGGAESGSSGAPTAAVRGVQGRAQGCRVPAGDQRVPLEAPRAHWDKVGDYQVPGSTLVGPGVVDGHVRRCWAHSPTGAVMAAYNYVAAQDTWPTDVAMLRELTAPSDVRDEALRQGGSPAASRDVGLELIGFRVLSYSPAAATVLLGVRAAPKPSAEMDLGQTRSQLAEAPVRLLWTSGDWKVAVEAQGFQVEPLESLSTLVQWSAP